MAAPGQDADAGVGPGLCGGWHVQGTPEVRLHFLTFAFRSHRNVKLQLDT